MRGWSKTLVLIVGSALLVVVPGGVSRSAPTTRRSTDLLRGTYKAEVRGFVTGSGQVAVSAQHVHFNHIAVKDASGNQGQLHVRAALSADGRFKGTGQVLGRPVSLSGRLEVADRTVKIGRLLCSYTVEGNFGRIVAQKESAAVPAQAGGGG